MGAAMAPRKLLLTALALSALLALPAIASGEAGFFDETEPDTTITDVDVNSKRGKAKVRFEATDPVDAPENLGFDCYVDGGESDEEEDEGDEEGPGGESDDEPGDDADGDEGDEAEGEDEPDEEEEDEADERSARGDGEGDTEFDCESPLVLKKLDPGMHVIEVVAVDEEWNEDPTPASASFKVKRR
jgi:hypothetical protein